MSLLGDARAEVAAALAGVGIDVRESPSTGQMSPPAAIVAPGPDWISPQVILGSKITARVSLTVTLLTGRVAAGASLAALEDLLETALPALTPGPHYAIAIIPEPFGLTIAGTEYLATTITLVKSITLT
jgi:hypothetical protein